MNEPQTPPAAPQAATEKKKFGALAWILVGCFVILLIGALVTVTCTAFVAKKAKDFASEVSENPAMAGAEMIVRMNPELELVDKDENSETLTIRNKKTGEVATLNLQDIQEGRFSWEADGKQVTIDGAAAAKGEGGGLITVTDESGEETVSIGTGSAEQIPDWVPTYPGAAAEAPFLMTSGEGIQGTLSFETDDSLAVVRDFYISELETRGFGVEKSSFSSGEMETAMLSATADDSRNVLVSITNENSDVTRVGITFSREM